MVKKQIFYHSHHMYFKLYAKINSRKMKILSPDITIQCSKRNLNIRVSRKGKMLVKIWLYVFPCQRDCFFFFIFIQGHAYWFQREGKEGNIDVRENINQLPPVHAPTGDQTCNLGMCFDQESSPQHFCLQDGSPTNWATPARARSDSFKI